MFLDTSGLLAFLDRKEPKHAEATQFFHNARFRLTHNYVLAELVALADKRAVPRRQVLDFLADLDNNLLVEVEFVTESRHRSAVDMLARRLDKEWSLCDAVSFLMMESRGLQEALTTDHHFEQAGFVRLLVELSY